MKIHNNNVIYLDKVIVTLGFIFVFLAAIVIARIPPASKYEISIYQAYPTYFWILISVGLLCGVIVLIHKAFGGNRQHISYFSAYALLVFINLLIIMLPLYRGYFISSTADEITHLGYITDIISTGHLGDANIYPISHILSTQVSFIGRLDTRTVIKIIPAFFYVLYMLGLLLLARSVARKDNQIYLILAFGSVLLFTDYNYLFFPTQNILYVLPLFLCMFIKSRSYSSWSYGICSMILLISLPFFHPLGSLLVLAIIIFINLSSFLSRAQQRIAPRQIADPYSNNSGWIHAIILGVVFFSWFSNFGQFGVSVKHTFAWFIRGEGAAPIVGVAKGAAEIHYSLFDVFIRIMKNYGQDIVFALLALAALVFLLNRFYSNRHAISTMEILFSLVFALLSLFAFLSIFVGFIGTTSDLRLFCWPLVAGVMINGLVYYDWLSLLSGLKKILTIGAIITIIFISTINGIFNVYYSPIIDNGDLQVTLSEWQSMRWFLNSKDFFTTFVFDQLPSRAPHAIYGTDSPKPTQVGYFEDIPAHLGYDHNSSLRDSLKTNSYLVIDEREKIVKTVLRPNIGFYRIEDLNRVYVDPGVSLIYASAGTDICFVAK